MARRRKLVGAGAATPTGLLKIVVLEAILLEIVVLEAVLLEADHERTARTGALTLKAAESLHHALSLLQEDGLEALNIAATDPERLHGLTAHLAGLHALNALKTAS